MAAYRTGPARSHAPKRDLLKYYNIKSPQIQEGIYIFLLAKTFILESALNGYF